MLLDMLGYCLWLLGMMHKDPPSVKKCPDKDPASVKNYEDKDPAYLRKQIRTFSYKRGFCVEPFIIDDGAEPEIFLLIREQNWTYSYVKGIKRDFISRNCKKKSVFTE